MKKKKIALSKKLDMTKTTVTALNAREGSCVQGGATALFDTLPCGLLRCEPTGQTLCAPTVTGC